MENIYNKVNMNPPVSIIPLNVSGLNLPLKKTEIVRMDWNTNPTTCGLEEALLISNIDSKACIYIHILKVCTQFFTDGSE